MAETEQRQNITLWVQVNDSEDDVVSVNTTNKHHVSDVLEFVKTSQALVEVPRTALKLLKEKGGTPVSPKITVGELLVGRNIEDNFFLANSGMTCIQHLSACLRAQEHMFLEHMLLGSLY